MPHAELTLTLPDSVWIGELSRAHPETVFRVLAAITDDGRGIGLLEIGSSTLSDVIADVRDAEAVAGVELLQASEESALVQFETTAPFLLLPAQGSGVPLEMPFTIRDGAVTIEVTAPRDRLSALADQLEAFGIEFRVDRIEQRVGDERLLTERQRRLVRAAVEAGYYDTPRTCSLTELADRLGIAKSTCSETLHRAEGRIVKRFVNEELPDSEPPELRR